VRVLWIPDFGDSNPALRMLASAIQGYGVEMQGVRAYQGRWLPLLHAVRSGPRPDVIHLHHIHPFIDRPGGGDSVSRLLAARLIAELRLIRARGIRIVWTVHNVTKHERPDPRPEIAVARRVVALSDRVLVHCEAARQTVISAYGVERHADRIRVIPDGTYLGAYPNLMSRSQAREQLGIDDDVRLFVFVGQIRPYKGIPALVSAFRGVSDDRARLLIAGLPKTPAEADRLRGSVADDPRIRLDLRFVADEELQVFLNACDAAVFPFLRILNSGTILLALAFGRAMVVPRIGCIPEMVDEESALLYDPSRPDGLRGALERATRADLAAMGRHARAIADRMDWRVAARQTIAAYRG
jgi:beta-1,4-mannosyltransferase